MTDDWSLLSLNFRERRHIIDMVTCMGVGKEMPMSVTPSQSPADLLGRLGRDSNCRGSGSRLELYPIYVAGLAPSEET